jgi:hypothetical protein
MEENGAPRQCLEGVSFRANTMRFFVRLPLLLLVLLAGVCVASANSFRNQGGAVYVNETLVLTLRSTVGRLTAEQRAAALVARLQRLPIEQGITIGKSGNEHRLMVGSEVLLVIPPQEARASNTTTAALATQWHANIRQALAIPLRLSEKVVVMPSGGTRRVGLVGRGAAQAMVESSNEQVVRAERVQGAVVLRAVGFGRANVVVSGGGTIESIQVEVLPNAANFPQQLSVTVTGNPANSETVIGAVEGILRTQLSAEPGASWSFDPIIMGALPAGESRNLQVRVRAQAPDRIATEGIVNVAVRNVAIAHRSEAELWYCNYPESVRSFGSLFKAHLKRENPARMLYHHINVMQQGMYITVQVLNESDVPARVLVMPGDSQPDKNPVLAGVRAGDQFFRNWLSSSGEVITVPPRSVFPISIRRLAPQETMSGLCYLRLLDGGPDKVTVRTDSRPPFNVDARWQQAMASTTPWRIIPIRTLSVFDTEPHAKLSEHVYPNPFREEEVTYLVGGRHGFVRIGQKPISRADQGAALDGNFGVLYRIRAHVENPTDFPADLEIVFEASAGYSGALFVVNGVYKRVPMLQSKEESKLLQVRLDPGARRTFEIMTVPLSGSSYPATLSIRPNDPTSAAGSKPAIITGVR